MALLGRGQAVVEQLCLVVVLLELCTLGTRFDTFDLLRILWICAFGLCCRRPGLESVGPVVDSAFVDRVATLPIAVEVHDGANRSVDGKFLPVGSETRQLGVEVAEASTL